jgi:hypothetical protein
MCIDKPSPTVKPESHDPSPLCVLGGTKVVQEPIHAKSNLVAQPVGKESSMRSFQLPDPGALPKTMRAHHPPVQQYYQHVERQEESSGGKYIQQVRPLKREGSVRLHQEKRDHLLPPSTASEACIPLPHFLSSFPRSDPVTSLFAVFACRSERSRRFPGGQGNASALAPAWRAPLSGGSRSRKPVPAWARPARHKI